MTTNRRGGRILLWAVVLYGAATVAVNGAVDGWWPELRSPYLVDTFHQLNGCPSGRPDIVCIGTSRLAMAFCADEVQSQLIQRTGDVNVEVFNASAGSQDLITADFILAELLARGARPSLAIIEVAPELLARHDLWLGNHVLPVPTRRNCVAYAGDLARAWRNHPGIIADRAYPVYRCRQQAWTVLGNVASERLGLSLNPRDPNSWARRGVAARSASAAALLAQGAAAGDMFLDTDRTHQRRERVADGLRTIRGWLENYEVDGLTCAALEQLLDRCRRHQVGVVLALPPVASEQRQLYSPAIEARFQECLRGFCQRHDCRCVDCRAYLPDRCFFDNHHVLIPAGSIPFSRQLAEEVIVPEWLARHGHAGFAQALDR